MDALLNGLLRGRQPHVRTVGSEADVRRVFDTPTDGAWPAPKRTHPGWMTTPDGHGIGFRPDSKAGGSGYRGESSGRNPAYRAHPMSQPWSSQAVLDYLPSSGVDDWIDMHLVAYVVRSQGVIGSDEVTVVAFGVIAQLIARGLVWPGDLVPGEKGLRLWETSADEALMKIVEGWNEVGPDELYPGAVCWLQNTEPGEELGEAVLRREGHDV